MMPNQKLQSLEVTFEKDEHSERRVIACSYSHYPPPEETRPNNRPTYKKNLLYRSKPVRSLLSAITLRQSGLLSKTKYDISVYQAKMTYPNMFHCRFKQSQHVPLDLVRNNGNYFFVFRSVFNERIDRFQFRYEHDGLIKMYSETGYLAPTNALVQDVCALGHNHIVYIANTTHPDPNYRNEIGVTPIMGHDVPFSYWPVQDRLRCCDYDPMGQIIVVGTAANLIRIQNHHHVSPINSISCDIYSVALRNHGRNVIYAEKSGHIYDIDIRTKHKDLIVKMKNCIHKMKPLDTGHEVIVSGYDHQLCLIDMRMKKVSREFQGHVNNDRTIPFSYCDTTKLLCSAGDDSRIRIWSLGQSSFLTVLPSPSVPSRDANNSFLGKDDRWNHLYTFSKRQISVHKLDFGSF